MPSSGRQDHPVLPRDPGGRRRPAGLGHETTGAMRRRGRQPPDFFRPAAPTTLRETTAPDRGEGEPLVPAQPPPEPARSNRIASTAQRQSAAARKRIGWRTGRDMGTGQFTMTLLTEKRATAAQLLANAARGVGPPLMSACEAPAQRRRRMAHCCQGPVPCAASLSGQHLSFRVRLGCPNPLVIDMGPVEQLPGHDAGSLPA